MNAANKVKYRPSIFFIVISVIPLCLLFSFIECIPTGQSEASITFTVTRLTFSPYDDVQCRTNDRGDVVWVKKIGEGGEVYRFTSGFEVIDELSYNPFRAGNPQINNRGDVAWWQYDGFDEESDSEIYCYQVEEKKTIRFTDNGFSDFHPRINNSGDIVWYGEAGEFPDNDYEVFLYVYSMGYLEQVTGTINEGTIEQMMSYYCNDCLPQINDNMDLVWQATVMREDMPVHEICSRFAESEQTYLTEVWDEFTTCMLAQINDQGDVVWQSSPISSNVPGEPGEDLDSEIFLFSPSPVTVPQHAKGLQKKDHVPHEILNQEIQIGVITRITDNDCNDSDPQINNSGLVVWWSYYTDDWLDMNMKRSDQLPDSEIYLYDKKTGSTLTITNNDYDDRFPYVSDLDYIVWMGHDGHDWEIYLYDYALGSTTQLTDNLSDDEFPHICSNFVVWQGKVDNQYEIFRATIRK